MRTLYWHDYETFGTIPKLDRPVQFAGVRTDEALNVVGEPLAIYCKPADDVLPQPQSCLITGITPQLALEKGVSETQFIAAIHEQLAHPGTCGVGYNSIRFDDEVTRYALYRNFFDPYGREWQNGNSRWDIIDMVRLTRALRPEGIEWPVYEDGRPNFKLEDLTRANDITHDAAHDALSDVYATIALAKLIKTKQPKLYHFVYHNRTKSALATLLDLDAKEPVLHVSGMYPAEYGCIAVVMPIAPHPTNKNGIIVYDLRDDPAPLLTLSVAEIKKYLFTARSALPDDSPRIPLKTVHLNKCPVVVPTNTLSAHAAERFALDLTSAQKYRNQLVAVASIGKKVQQVFMEPYQSIKEDPDQALYSGGFFSNRDKQLMQVVRETRPEALHQLRPAFDDERLSEMFFRYRARNYPDSLTAEEKQSWDRYRLRKLTQENAGNSIVLQQYFDEIAQLELEYDHSPEKLALLSQLIDYAKGLDLPLP